MERFIQKIENAIIKMTPWACIFVLGLYCGYAWHYMAVK